MKARRAKERQGTEEQGNESTVMEGKAKEGEDKQRKATESDPKEIKEKEKDGTACTSWRWRCAELAPTLCPPCATNEDLGDRLFTNVARK